MNGDTPQNASLKHAVFHNTTVVYCLVSQQHAQTHKTHCRTYIGYTTCLVHRLRQHRGELKGGAKATRCANDWRVLWVMYGFQCRRHAQQVEWRLHHMRRQRGGGGVSRTDNGVPRAVLQRYRQLYHACHTLRRVTQTAPPTASTAWRLYVVDHTLWQRCLNIYPAWTWTHLHVVVEKTPSPTSSPRHINNISSGTVE